MDCAPGSRLGKEHYLRNTMIFRAALHYVRFRSWYCRRMHPCANLLAPRRRSQTSWGLRPAGSGQQHRKHPF
uniref:Uncharacterized protein n=1 Tax=Triticum urartu TaxID=4572 RepID=A0A8R7NYB8_TRIUA